MATKKTPPTTRRTAATRKTRKTVKRGKTTKATKPSENWSAYAKLLDGLQLRSVRLVSAEVQTERMVPEPEGKVEVQMPLARAVQASDGFEAIQELQVILMSPRSEEIARIRVEYGAAYDSRISVNSHAFEAAFATFRKQLLPLHVWPFIRAFVHSTMGQMSWPVLTLPLMWMPGEPEDP